MLKFLWKSRYSFICHFINNKSYNLGIAFRQPKFLILLCADKGFCEWVSEMNVSQDCSSLCKGWQQSICDICICPLEEQIENYELLAKATFINSRLDENTRKTIWFLDTLLYFCLIQGCSWMLVSWSPFSYFVLKKLPLITVFSETVPADESCWMFSQQN